MNTQKKIVSVKFLKQKIAFYRKQKKKIAFTNGCFDLLHLGHVRYLEQIKKDNNVLVVAVNSDLSVKKIKKNGRPIQPQKARAGVVAALACVDHVIIFNEPTPDKLVSILLPDLLVKGADWKGKAIAGESCVKARSGRVCFVPYISGFSTTQIIEKIKKIC